MTVNFEIEENYALTYNGRHIDLHNNFNFIGCDYQITDRQLTLTWTRSKGDWVKEDELSKLTLIHYNVFFLSVGYDNKEYEYPEDDRCLAAISFFPSTDRQINNGTIPQDKPKERDDIIYIFETDHYIRVGCDKVVLVAD
jgi:hypothetical protein